ncbi:ABC transporter permease [Labrys okinawensis]|uniref:ABC transporter permease n=1 Tax=Labrys okinawensis TaxID=346911 RepID=UPI0039BD3BB5
MKALLRRILQLIGVLFGISAVTFLLVRLAPGDPARILAGERASAATVEAIRHQYGFDQSLWDQFAYYCLRLLQGNMGWSLKYQRPVIQLIEQFISPTLFLTAYVICISVPVVVVGAIASASKPRGFADNAIRIVGVASMTIPVFWLAIMLSRLFGIALGWFPVSGYGDTFVDRLHHLFLPAFSMSLWLIPVLLQSLRAALIEKAQADFVTAARAAGASEREILWRTVLPNSVVPTLNLLGVMIAYVIAGTIIVETVYAIPGLGTLMISSLLGRDYYVVQGLTLLFAVSTVLVTFIIDITTMMIDPRIRG